MEKLILELERQIHLLQAARQLLLDANQATHLSADSVSSTQLLSPPVKRGRGRPRKNPPLSIPENSAA